MNKQEKNVNLEVPEATLRKTKVRLHNAHNGDQH